MDRDRNLNPDFLKNFVTIHVSSATTKSHIKAALLNRERIVFIVDEHMQVLIGAGNHTDLTQELGIRENNEDFMKGTAQFAGGGLSINSGWYNFFQKMGIEGLTANDLWESIRSKIHMELI